tara:strand:- start:484 stop:1521 length:1038 start_codon:yes stop_codon:yes gene_type:complete
MSLTLKVLRKFHSSLIFLLLFNCNSNQKDDFKQLTGNALGTTYSISYSSSKLNKNLLSHKIDSIIKIINASMSTYDKDSDISKINKGDSLLEVDTHFIKVYNTATQVWIKTKGYFDPTVGALVNAYGFGPNRTHESVSPYQRNEILKYTGWEKTKLTSKNTIQKKHPNLFFDFNAIAKGYTVDLISEYLRLNQVSSFLVEIGGEIVAQGVSPKSNLPWKIAIDNPKQDEEKKFIKSIFLNNQALATSGNYRKYKLDKKTGKRYVHSVNPKTGNSFPSEVLSASVIAPTCMVADAYATALMVMPFEKSKLLIEKEENLEAFWIIENEKGVVEQYFSKGFYKNLSKY